MLEYAEIIKGDKDAEDIYYIEGVEFQHPEYKKYAPRWKKARDVIDGEDTLKSIGNRETYIPRLSGHINTKQGNDDYASFVEYAEFYNATGRSVEAYRGLLNRKLPQIKVPNEAKDLINSFTIKGESMHTFIEQLEVETTITNRVGLLIDHPYIDPDKKLSKHDAKNMNLSPYGALYPAEAIINWEEKRINNRIMTNLVVLREEEYVRVATFLPEIKTTYRVLELDLNGFYRQVVIEPEAVSSGLDKQIVTRNVVKSVVYPTWNGEMMNFIPFYPITAQGITWELTKSVIADLVNVNIAHFRNTAFHEKAIAWTASPTAVFSGLPDDTQSVAIGSTQAVIIAPGGTAKYLEYEGDGLSSIKEALDKKEQQMAILGAKILANEIKGVESGEAALIHRAGEQGILADIATTIGGAMEKAIRIICDWRVIRYKDNDIVVDINKDYTPAIIDANTVIALGQEVNAGRLSYESYIGAMQRGEIIPPTRTAKEEIRLINKTHKGALIGSKEKLTYLEKRQMDDVLNRVQPEPEPDAKTKILI